MPKNLLLVLFVVSWSLFGYSANLKNQHLSVRCESAFSSSKENKVLYKKVDEVINYLPLSIKEYRSEKNKWRDPKEIFEEMVKQRVKQINELSELAEQSSQVNKELLKISILKLENDLEANLVHVENKFKAFRNVRSWEDLVQLANTKSGKNADALLSNIRGFFLESRAVLTETLVALQAEKLNATEMYVENILEDKFIHLFEKVKHSKRFLNAKDLEMDVVANGYREWIEVKSYNNRTKKYANRLLESLEKKTLRVKKLTDLLYEKYGFETQFHIVIVGNGKLPRGFKEKLEAKGAVLHFGELDSRSFLK